MKSMVVLALLLPGGRDNNWDSELFEDPSDLLLSRSRTPDPDPQPVRRLSSTSEKHPHDHPKGNKKTFLKARNTLQTGKIPPLSHIVETRSCNSPKNAT
jgi:hypothetical protein